MEFYATLGTACSRRETLEDMFRAGMTGLRLNLSHTSLKECRALLESRFFPAARAAGVVPQLMIDLQGPELRVGRLPYPIQLREGKDVLLGDGGIPVPDTVLDMARPGRKIALDDSAMLLEVRRASPSVLLCRVVRGGTLNSKKSLAVLGLDTPAPTLTREDLANLDLAGELGVTCVMQPFVRGCKDVENLRQALDRRGLDIPIMAKIESRQGVERLDEILSAADQLCIARGDLGNTMPLWQLPGVQKRIARRCREEKKPFCLVTQLLWSMQENPVPTRAEVADIYNGVLDGAAALMLTGETAIGKHPVQAMTYLAKTARCAGQDMQDMQTQEEI